MAFAIKADKGGRRKVPIPPSQPSLVLGSRPASMRSPAIPRIKPMEAQRAYGKSPAPTQTGFDDFTGG
jgi:hypothetical protein